MDQRLGFAYLETAGRSGVLGCHRARPDGWEGTHPLPSYWNGQRFMEKTPGQAHISPEAPSGPLSLAASAVTLCLAHSRHRMVAPLESKNKQMAAS